MPILGALSRIEAATMKQTSAALGQLDGVETFDLGDEHKLGILIEAPSLDAIHQILTSAIPHVEGVLGVWPIYVNNEDGVEFEFNA